MGLGKDQLLAVKSEAKGTGARSSTSVEVAEKARARHHCWMERNGRAPSTSSGFLSLPRLYDGTRLGRLVWSSSQDLFCARGPWGSCCCKSQSLSGNQPWAALSESPSVPSGAVRSSLELGGQILGEDRSWLWGWGRGRDSGAPWPGMLLRKHCLPRTGGATVEGYTRGGLPTHQPAPPSAPGVVPTRATLPQAAATACWSAPRLWRPYPSRAWLGVPQTVTAFPPSHSGREQIPEGCIKTKAEHQGWLSEGRGMEISPCICKSRGLNPCDLIHRLGQSCVCGISEQMGITTPEMDQASAAVDFGNNYTMTWIKSESELTPQWPQMVQGPT